MELGPKEYMTYIDSEKSGLIQKKQLGPFTIQSEYKTPAYIALKEAYKFNNTVSSIDISELQNIQEFYLRISSKNNNDFLKDGQNSTLNYEQRVSYFSESIKDDISLLINNIDTVPCMFSILERNYGLSPYSTLVIGFNMKDKGVGSQNLSLIINDHVLGVGPVIFQYDYKKFKNIPVLKLSR